MGYGFENSQGSIQITHKSFYDNTISPRESLVSKQLELISQVLEKEELIASYTYEIQFSGLVGTERKSKPFFGVGVEPSTSKGSGGVPVTDGRKHQKIIDLLPELNLNKKVLIRLDSGHDAQETFNVLLQNNRPFIVKKNLRRESSFRWLELAMTKGVKKSPREGKDVYIGSLTAPHPTADSQYPEVEQVFKVTVRETDAKGDPFLIPELDVEVYFTNLNESPETIISLYHNHGLQ